MPLRFICGCFAALHLLSFSARAEYSYFYTSTGGSLSGSDIIMKELRWPYWNSYYYNTWVNDNWTSSDGVSGYFYNGLALPAAGSPNPVGTQQTFNFSFWPLSNPINISDTISSVYTSPTTFSMQTIGEGTLFRSPGLWSLWQTNVWYRMAIRTWQPASGAAHQGYAGTWLRDPVAGVWYHMATVQLPLAVTGITGADGFQENASGSALPERTDYRNCYYHRSGVWSPASEFQVYNHAGATENAGLIETNSAVYYETCENDPSYTGTITNVGQYSPVYSIANQPAKPPLDPIIVTNYGSTLTSTQLLVQWQIPATSSPQFAYQINVYTNASHTGAVATAFFDYAPDTRQKLLTVPAGITPYPQLTIIDVFNQTNAPVSLTVTNASLIATTSISGLANGLAFSYYESASDVYSSSDGSNWSSMPNFAALTPVYNGVANNLDLTQRRRRNGYAFNYTGYLNVATNGIYTFTLTSDAGSKLYVDGQLVVNWDGDHSPSSLSGWVGLQAGYHALNVQYFCDTQPTALFSEYFDTLGLSYEGPGITLTPVPANIFYHLAGSMPAVSLSSPTNGATVSGASLPLTASVTANGSTINNVQFYVGNNYWGGNASAPYSLNSFFWDTNNNAIRARVFYNNTNVVDSTANVVATTNMSIAPWQFNQIFYHNMANAASITNGTYSVIGDGMNLLTRQVSGNCTLIAHLAGLPTTAAAPDGSTPSSGWGAGIILRGNTNMTPGYPWGQSGTAPFTAVMGQVGGGAYYQDETMVNGGGGYTSDSLGSQTWFKIQRTNNTFISSVSANGVNWTAVWTNTLTDFGSTVYAGFFTYAGPSSNPNVPWASFNDVSLTGNILGPPGVTVVPQTSTLYAGQNATLSASPSGNAPFAYQWQVNGTNLPAATNATLSLSNLQASASGQYTMILSNANGTATATATISVLTPSAPVTAILSNNPVGYWRLNETTGPTAYDAMGIYNGTGQGGIGFDVPGVTNAPFTGFETANLAAQFNGDSSPSDIAIPPFNLTTTNLTITGWVNCKGTQDSWSGLVFSRGSGHGVGLMVVNNGGNELRYSWNDDGNDYNASTGLLLPSGQWAFVALTISASQATVYLATNATLHSWTNKVTNISQNFSGDFFLGCDPSAQLSGSRQFNGTLDEIAIYNQTLPAANLNQILAAAQQPTPPGISLISPANGTSIAAPASLNLSAGVSTNGHVINYVEYFSGANLLGISSNAPYGCSWTNIPAGAYAVYAQLVYDGGSQVSSAPAFISVNSVPLTPVAPTVTALASNLVVVSWPPAAYATSYSVLRAGNIIATVTQPNYQDLGVMAGGNYCYSIIANNNFGTSAAGPESCVTTPTIGLALAWNAGASTTNVMDGSGNWGSSLASWWNGSSEVDWANAALALVGTGTTTNCTITLANNLTPGGIIFNPNSGGAYTLGGGYAINLTNTVKAMTIEADDANSILDVVMEGAGGFVKTGAGTLTLSLAGTLTGSTTVSNGTLLVNAYQALADSAITIESNATVSAVVSGGNAFQYYTKTMTVKSGGTLTLGNGSFSNIGGYLYLEGGAVLDGADSGSWGSWQINTDSSIHVTNGSPVAAVISAQGLHSINGKQLIFNVANVTGDTQVDLLLNGTLTTGDGDDSNFGITKLGAGTMALTGDNTYIGATTNTVGTLQVDGVLANSSKVVVAAGATLSGQGIIVAPTTIQSGGILAPGDNAIGTLTISNTLNLAGTTVMGLNQTGAVLTNDLVAGVTTLTCGGALVVTNVSGSPLAVGDTFTLFSTATYAGSFASVTLPPLPFGLAWSISNLTVNGSIAVYAPPVPFIAGATWQGNGKFQITGTGAVGQPYILLASSNLMSPIAWTPIVTNLTTGNGELSFSNLPIPGTAWQFFRATAP